MKTSKTNSQPILGLKENLFQFSLLVVINAFVGAMIGLERSILPTIAEQEFHLAAKSAILSFIVVFGFTKALMNYFAGRLSDKYGRKVVLVSGWLVAIPVPFLLMWAPSWDWILFANVLLGISQGLTWSTTVIMKIDLAGPSKRGLAMGLNEFAGYFAVAASALATGYIATHFGLRPEPFYLGIGYVALGLVLSIWFVRETHAHTHHEAKVHHLNPHVEYSQKDVFLKTSFKDRELSSITQAGFVNNLNDGMAWGLFPIFFAAAGVSLERIAWLAAIYPASWGIFQLWTGHLSDRVGRKWLIVWGMWVQSVGISLTVSSSSFLGFMIGSFLLGLGTAMVYPTLLAAIGDVAHPSWRASSVGIYRFWRDSGYAAGAIVAGFTADFFGLDSAIWRIAGITALSGVVVAVRMRETLNL
ncbi:MAG: MFS transporter [Bdellovibrionales bacterium]